MWTRSQLKDNAKSYLKSIYLLAFAVSLIMAIVGSSGPDFKYNIWNGYERNFSQEEKMERENWIEEAMSRSYVGRLLPDETFKSSREDHGLKEEDLGPVMFIATLAFGIFAVIFSIGLILSIFIFNPLILGGKRFFLNAAQDRTESFSDMGYAFSSSHYWNVVLTLFLRNLFIFLWSLLLIIPGIIKKYAYSMVPYLLCENPEMTYKEALETSDDMTRGHKWDMFVLDLSFIGWYLLASVLLGFGILFVHPYYNATHAELYLALKNKTSLTIDYDHTIDYDRYDA